MKIEILEFVEGAGKATGLTVIIDVFRAFSVACYAIDAGATRLIATGDVNEGFDYGNSPTEIIKANLAGKTVIQTTTAGTSGLINASNASTVITGSFVNAGAVVRYINKIKPVKVSLVAMGYRSSVSAEEDLLCAELLSAMITGKKINFQKRISDLRFTSGKRFFNPENLDYSPPTDFFLCTMSDRFNFILKANQRFDGNIDLSRIDI